MLAIDAFLISAMILLTQSDSARPKEQANVDKVQFEEWQNYYRSVAAEYDMQQGKGRQTRLKLQPNARPFEAEYDNLPDYVRFSHARHARRKIGCPECHGDVTRQDETEPANALNMKACVDCHEQRKATVACGVCHSIR